ncbi:FdhF/YdeP family oxidoreductase [Aquincola sp. MAHUQ-54]|uniref:FdhF/YdeP family oxidoreductase n=1 Tax=Aquincola agrisoli TaxID=3119538 RepID=A0AAW9QFY8_9BURK
MSNDDTPRFEPYEHPAGGWGSLKAVAAALRQARIPIAGAQALARQNKPGGFACVSCAWAKPAQPHAAEFCENGAKATAWELTDQRAGPAFFSSHTLTELETWSDHDLEAAGRLTVPMRWDARTDRYVETGWDEAFEAIGQALRAVPPQARDGVVFYASGRASLEASYMYQLLARRYGTNNLPDSSNMCHESTSVALPQTLGVPVGTVTLDDFEHTDAIFFFGQNVGVSSPRMLHQLQAARRERDIPIVTFNPLKERGLVSFANPQSPLQMLTPATTDISTQYHQLRIGGDIAAITGLCLALLQADDEARARGEARRIDTAFIAEHTHGFAAFEAYLRACRWEDIERESGLARAALESAAAVFARARSVICVYGMGLTQHRHGVLNVQMVSNLLLMGGHVGRPGAGICPVRGHSNVQGQRTVGITEKPELAPLDQLKKLYGFEPPRGKGLDTVGACEAIRDGRLHAFIGLGGNFLRAVPETALVEAGWRRLPLTVQVATKLNRSHVVHGQAAYLLPCLGRIEIDRQRGVPQTVSVEDSTGFMHASDGVAEPAAATLRSEPAIVAALAQAVLGPDPGVPWAEWSADYAKVRDAIEATWPDVFRAFNERFRTPGGFHRPIPARQREWKTPTGKANFIVPDRPPADAGAQPSDPAVLRLMTVRSDDQFNTTVYTLDDRFRGIYGTRRVLLMNRADIERLGLAEGMQVVAETAVDDGVRREVGGLRVTPFDIPPGCAAGYYPECNPLLPLWHHAEGSHVPAAKSIPIRVRPLPASLP